MGTTNDGSGTMVAAQGLQQRCRLSLVVHIHIAGMEAMWVRNTEPANEHVYICHVAAILVVLCQQDCPYLSRLSESGCQCEGEVERWQSGGQRPASSLKSKVISRATSGHI